MIELDNLENLLQAIPDLDLAVLIGSQAHGNATTQSDWDIALLWKPHVNRIARIEYLETLRQQIADVMAIHKDKIDFIDITSARLAMRAVIAEEGIVLKGGDSLAWSHYLTQTWSELEDYYWRLSHAA
jgi:predicted nucleotidyltransferase